MFNTTHSENIVVNYNTGEILNCQKIDIYMLYTDSLIRFNDGLKIYVFLDKNRKVIFNTIIRNLKVDMKVNHEKYGNGKITKFLGGDQLTIVYRTFMSLSSIDSVICNISGMYKIIS